MSVALTNAAGLGVSSVAWSRLPKRRTFFTSLRMLVFWLKRYYLIMPLPVLPAQSAHKNYGAQGEIIQIRTFTGPVGA